MRLKRTALTLLIALGVASQVLAEEQSNGAQDSSIVQHVLLVSVDGLHQADLDWYVKTHGNSTLAKLVNGGVEYTNAWTPFPSDSFPGMVGQVTGGNPKTTGIYYDDAYSRDLQPAGTTNCKKTPTGAEVFYAEVIAKDQFRIDSGQPIPDLYTVPPPPPSTTDLAKVLLLTSDPIELIDANTLPVDPAGCTPVYPHQYLKANTVFEVAHTQGWRTAWSDKHAAYEILSGPSGAGIDDLFAPEINSNVDNPSNTGAFGTSAYGGGDDWTKDNTNTQRYDAVKVQAVVNWINGFDHTYPNPGYTQPGTPVIFGMNFQAVSTAQKLNTSNYYPDPSNPSVIVPNGLGGYVAGTVPGVVLQSALDFVNGKLTQMMDALQASGNGSNTAVILSAKHGQSPQNRADLTIINDGDMIDALNAAWDPTYQTDNSLPLVAHAIDDDGILMWLNDRRNKALAFAKSFLLNYSGSGVGSDPLGNKTTKAFSQAGTKTIYVGKEVADLIGVKQNDGRVPDLVGIAQQGVVYAGSKLSKIAEHGGDAEQDRHVPIVVWGPGIRPGVVADEVETTQIAPSILTLLGLSPTSLTAVRAEGTLALPQLR
jgi:hypothetical protein